MGKKALLLNLTEEEYSLLKQLAEKEDRTMSWILRKLIRKEVESNV